MIIGIPREIKNHEYRVGLIPAGVDMLVQSGHRVIIEAGAGRGSGYDDTEYTSYGAELAKSASAVWASADIIVKVKEPQPEEYGYFRSGLTLFAYLHLAADPQLAEAIRSGGITAIAYEEVQLEDGRLPLLIPMSEIAGRMSVQIGAGYLEKRNGGSGILLGGVPGVAPAEVVIIGGGIVGSNAAKVSLGLGAHTTVIDNDANRLRYLDDVFGGRVTTLMSNPQQIDAAAVRADLLIGAVLVPSQKAPRLVTESTVRRMKEGAVIIDVAVDQGGSIETVDRVTTHSAPVYIKHGVIHYAVANMPGAVPKTSTAALTNATFPYIRQLADYGLESIISAERFASLAKGICFKDGVEVKFT